MFLAAIVTKGTEITKVVHLGRRFTSEQRTALQWRDPICARKGCDNRLGLQYDHFEDWAHTHTTRVGAPPTGPVQDTGTPPLLHELADAARAALRARHGALART